MEPERPILYNVGPEVPAMPYRDYSPEQSAPKQRVWVHVLLFLLTIITTSVVGMFLFSRADGPIFSAAILSILTAHEFGHYFTARKYGVPVSLPYFIPFPSLPFGTLGAIIRMSPRIPNRQALFDIAAAGPLAGMVLAIPLTYFGIAHSQIILKETIPPNSITVSEPLFFQAIGWLVHGRLASNVDMMLHPLAYAGWAGMFVTALNLLPIGQLDGGHITHALFGQRSRLVAGAMFLGLALYCIVSRNTTWIPLLLLLLFFGIQHPPSMGEGRSLGLGRATIGALLGIIFITCFSLVPIKF